MEKPDGISIETFDIIPGEISKRVNEIAGGTPDEITKRTPDKIPRRNSDGIPRGTPDKILG